MVMCFPGVPITALDTHCICPESVLQSPHAVELIVWEGFSTVGCFQ